MHLTYVWEKVSQPSTCYFMLFLVIKKERSETPSCWPPHAWASNSCYKEAHIVLCTLRGLLSIMYPIWTRNIVTPFTRFHSSYLDPLQLILAEQLWEPWGFQMFLKSFSLEKYDYDLENCSVQRFPLKSEHVDTSGSLWGVCSTHSLWSFIAARFLKAGVWESS